MALLVSLSLIGFTGAAATPEEKPMETVEDLKSNVVSTLEALEMHKLNLDDASVNLQFVMNKEGDLAVVSVEGENCLVNQYVTQMLKGKKIAINEALANKVHEISVRYVRL